MNSFTGEARFAAGEEKRIAEAIEALRKDPHAPRELSVQVVLHVHHEYPKHITIGEGENAKTHVVNSVEEEAALVVVAEPQKEGE